MAPFLTLGQIILWSTVVLNRAKQNHWAQWGQLRLGIEVISIEVLPTRLHRTVPPIDLTVRERLLGLMLLVQGSTIMATINTMPAILTVQKHSSEAHQDELKWAANQSFVMFKLDGTRASKIQHTSLNKARVSLKTFNRPRSVQQKVNFNRYTGPTKSTAVVWREALVVYHNTIGGRLHHYNAQFPFVKTALHYISTKSRRHIEAAFVHNRCYSRTI
jgi:hypothetical protein